MRLTFRIVGFVILAAGLVSCLFATMAIYDPVGAAHANDAAPLHPFGPDQAWHTLIQSIGIALFGLWIFMAGKK